MLPDSVVTKLSHELQTEFTRLTDHALAAFFAGRPDFEGITYVLQDLLDDIGGDRYIITFVKTNTFKCDAYDVYKIVVLNKQ